MSRSKQLSKQQIAKNNWVMEGFRNNRQEVIKSCYQEIYPMVTQLVTKNGGNRTDARSILHDALMVFRKKCQNPNFELTAKFSSFLYAICRLRWQRELHNRKKNVLNYLETLTDSSPDELTVMDAYKLSPSVENDLHAQELITWIYQLMEDTNPLCGKILKLQAAGKSHQEIAESLQITVGTSRKKLNHCRIYLAKKIKESSHFEELLSDSSAKVFLKKYLKNLLCLVFFI